MTEVSVETCFANLRVLSFSLKFWSEYLHLLWHLSLIMLLKFGNAVEIA